MGMQSMMLLRMYRIKMKKVFIAKVSSSLPVRNAAYMKQASVNNVGSDWVSTKYLGHGHAHGASLREIAHSIGVLLSWMQ